MHAVIREQLADAVGAKTSGSSTAARSAANARELLAVANVGGALVGGASLKADEFLAIAAAAHPREPLISRVNPGWISRGEATKDACLSGTGR